MGGSASKPAKVADEPPKKDPKEAAEVKTQGSESSASSASADDAGGAKAKAQPKAKPTKQKDETDEEFNRRMAKYEAQFRGKANLHEAPDAPNFAPVVQMLDRSLQMMLRETSKMRQPSKQEEMFKKQQELLQVTSDIRHLAKKWKLAGKDDLNTVLANLKEARTKLRGYGLTVEISDSTDSEDHREEIDELQAARRTMKNMQVPPGYNPYSGPMTGRSSFNTGANS